MAGSGFNGAIKRSTALPDLVGGGAPSYISGAEIPYDLSSASVVGTSAHVGKTIMLRSSTEGKSYTLPSAAALKLVSGKSIPGIGFRVDPQSKAIRIFNAGTAGTDAILEGLAMPGADFALYNYTASAAGNWRARGYGLFPGPVPVTLPSVGDAGFDTGDVMATANLSDTNSSSLNENILLTRLPGSDIFVFAWVPNAGTSVKAVALSIVQSTGAWTWGSAVTVASSANQWSHPRIVGVSATTYGCTAWEATAATAKVRGGTVSGQTITQGTALTSGAWSVNPSSIRWNQNGAVVKDAGGATFFQQGLHNGTAGAIAHFSFSGANVALDGITAFASSTPGTTTNFRHSYSPSSSVLETHWNSAATKCAITQFTYSGGSTTQTNTVIMRSNTTANRGVQVGDASARIYYGWNGTNIIRFVPNSGRTAMEEEQIYNVPRIVSATGTTQPDFSVEMRFISDSECMVIGGDGPASITLFNPQKYLRGNFVPSGTNNNADQGFNMIAPASAGFSMYMNQIMGTVIDTTARRMFVVYTNYDTNASLNRTVYAQAFDLPRNYDQ